MHDRIEAIGGDLTVDTHAGRGTRVIGSVRLIGTSNSPERHPDRMM
jgi:hypothetical protein